MLETVSAISLKMLTAFTHERCFDCSSTGCVVYEPHGKVREAARNALMPGDETTFLIILLSQTRSPTEESTRLARFKISANQSVILPPTLLALAPVFCSANVPRGS